MADYVLYNGELYHYGVPGMKWGVHRALSKSKQNDRLSKKALKYDKKHANLYKKAEKIHAEQDLERSNKDANKAAKYAKKASKFKKKALKTDDDLQKSVYEKRAAKMDYKSMKAQSRANVISKTTGYGHSAMKMSIKSDNARLKAEKARMKIASNEAYIAKMKSKAKSVPKEDIDNGYQFVLKLKDI